MSSQAGKPSASDASADDGSLAERFQLPIDLSVKSPSIAKPVRAMPI